MKNLLSKSWLFPIPYVCILVSVQNGPGIRAEVFEQCRIRFCEFGGVYLVCLFEGSASPLWFPERVGKVDKTSDDIQGLSAGQSRKVGVKSSRIHLRRCGTFRSHSLYPREGLELDTDL